MVLRSPAWKKAFSAHIQTGKLCKRCKSSAANSSAALAGQDGKERPPSSGVGSARAKAGDRSVDLTSLYTSITRNENQKKSLERDFLVSVFSSSPTKRDAKKYIQTFGGEKNNGKPTPSSQLTGPGTGYFYGSLRAVAEKPQFVQGTPVLPKKASSAEDQLHIAIVKIQDADAIDDTTLAGLAKTFVQLRELGLLSVIVVGPTEPAHNKQQQAWMEYITKQTLRVADAIDHYGEPVTTIVDGALHLDDSHGTTQQQHTAVSDSPYVSRGMHVSEPEAIMRPLRSGNIVIVPSYALSGKHFQAKRVEANEILLALTRYFSGIQAVGELSKQAAEAPMATDRSPEKKAKPTGPNPIASVDRVIIVDPVGGTPSKRRPNGAHIFVNMAEEYDTARRAVDKLPLQVPDHFPAADGKAVELVSQRHKANLDIARQTLALLPSTSSALFTTPTEAANLASAAHQSAVGKDYGDNYDDSDTDIFGLVGSVGTRRSQNPLIYNLLTDRPVFSSSLPLGRIKPKSRSSTSSSNVNESSDTSDAIDKNQSALLHQPPMPKTTLLKRGMPLSIYPNPWKTPWSPPKPGVPRLRLQDSCIDLARLNDLIDDSFGRKLDLRHYLDRVHNSLAGVIVAGQYDGAAILTWECPPGLDEETAYRTGRLVPYLDKFAVLKRSQGASGVADIVFTAMVRDCLPNGVCWRSRKNNPVNKWYFERSRGTWKLDNSNWTLFWTTPWESVGEQGLWDYANVCRNILPSWQD